MRLHLKPLVASSISVSLGGGEASFTDVRDGDSKHGSLNLALGSTPQTVYEGWVECNPSSTGATDVYLAGFEINMPEGYRTVYQVSKQRIGSRDKLTLTCGDAGPGSSWNETNATIIMQMITNDGSATARIEVNVPLTM